MHPPHWHMVVCGISHKTTSLSQREPLQIDHDELGKANALLSNLPGVMESTILSTCNRVEFFLVWDHRQEPFEIIRTFYKQLRDYDIVDLNSCFYTRKDKHTAAHLFRVVAGMDSMVLGENQIVGQVKEAYSSSCAVKSAGKVIHRLFHQAFRVGKQVRTDTEMGKGACSVSSAAIGMLKQKMDLPPRPVILFVGINQMIVLAASSLSKLNHGQFLFANRTGSKAVEFAKRHDGSGHSLDELPSLLAQADVVITCTGSQSPVITREMIDTAVKSNPRRFSPDGARLVIMDLAIPRDVEFNTGDHREIDVYDLDDIQQYVKNVQERRAEAIPQAEEIIERRMDEFKYWYNHVRFEPVYNGLANTFESIRLQEIAPVIEKLSPEHRVEIEAATTRLVDRLLQVKARTTGNSNNRE